MSSTHEPADKHLLDQPIAEAPSIASEFAGDGGTEKITASTTDGPGSGKNEASEAETPTEKIGEEAAVGEENSRHGDGQAGAQTHPEESTGQLSADTAALDLSKEAGESKESKKHRSSSPPPPPPPKDEKYLSGASPFTSPLPSPMSPTHSGAVDAKESAPNGTISEQKKPASNGAEGVSAEDDSKSEIQSIMDQFNEGKGGPAEEEIMSPRWERAGPLLGAQAVHPPRRSSLEPLKSPLSDAASSSSQAVQSPPPRTSSLPQSQLSERAALAETTVLDL